MFLRRLAVVLALALLVPATAPAQDFGVMESAETINRGNFKLMAYPLVVFGEGGADNDFGVVLRGGYGVNDRFDIEGKVGLYENIKFFGADAEVWLLKDAPLDLSIGGGFHLGRGESVLGQHGWDITFLGSAPISDKLEIYGGLDIAFNSIDDDFVDENFTHVHLVPGIEYSISPELDFVAELGIGLNGESANYFSAGIAYYIR